MLKDVKRGWKVSVVAPQSKSLDSSVRTVTFHALVYQPVEQGAAVVTESRAGVRVDLKLVFTSRILQTRGEKTINSMLKKRESTLAIFRRRQY